MPAELKAAQALRRLHASGAYDTKGVENMAQAWIDSKKFNGQTEVLRELGEIVGNSSFPSDRLHAASLPLAVEKSTHRKKTPMRRIPTGETGDLQ